MAPRRAARLTPGIPHPMGATPMDGGVNFALFSENAERVELCLFDKAGKVETARMELPAHTDGVWHGHLKGAKAGQLYGYRVHGPYAPHEGHRFNPHKLLVDPYAMGLNGRIVNHDANFAFKPKGKNADLTFDTRDNAAFMPKAVVVDLGAPVPAARPGTPAAESILYELHVGGMTRQHPGVDAPLRGTLAGLSARPVLDHLVDLGVTAVELMPIHPFGDEPHLVNKGLSNYWGYSPYAFFAPDPKYIPAHVDPTQAMAAFRETVDALHDAGIEVIMDVVYNHTVEGGHLGPTYSLRGIDNASYYHLAPDDRRLYTGETGCGNALNLDHPRVLQMVMDSLRHWVEHGHVDGFRFDLATTLGRRADGFSPHAGFLMACAQDPVLANVKLIAEPWDLGLGGYQLGRFPKGWLEWNDRFRNTVRQFWRGDEGVLSEFAHRLTGSEDVFAPHGRPPQAGINYVTAHDGFTLGDLVSYEHKHNLKNGEHNRDGTNANFSWNGGHEGPTKDAKIQALRQRQKRNFMATLLLSQGVPMLLAGDELGRSQGGNNNAYCQDNPTSWIDWSGVEGCDADFLAFVKTMIRIRKGCPAFRRETFFTGLPHEGQAIKDVTWWSPDGHEMQVGDWYTPFGRCVGMHIGDCDSIDECDLEPPMMVIVNAAAVAVDFHLPPAAFANRWKRVIDTAHSLENVPSDPLPADGIVTIAPHALLLLSGTQAKERA